jgi:hypothetical protein
MEETAMPIGHGGGESVECAQQNSGGEAEITQERAQASAAIAPSDAPVLQAAAAVLRTSQRYFGI